MNVRHAPENYCAQLGEWWLDTVQNVNITDVHKGQSTTFSIRNINPNSSLDTILYNAHATRYSNTVSARHLQQQGATDCLAHRSLSPTLATYLAVTLCSDLGALHGSISSRTEARDSGKRERRITH